MKLPRKLGDEKGPGGLGKSFDTSAVIGDLRPDDRSYNIRVRAV